MNIPTCSTQPQDHTHIFRKIFHRRTRPHAPATRRHVPGTLTASTDAVRNIPLALMDSVNGVRNIPSPSPANLRCRRRRRKIAKPANLVFSLVSQPFFTILEPKWSLRLVEHDHTIFKGQKLLDHTCRQLQKPANFEPSYPDVQILPTKHSEAPWDLTKTSTSFKIPKTL